MSIDTKIAETIIQAVSYVFSTVSGINPIAGEPYIKTAQDIKKNKASQGDFSATVSVTGDRRGSISIVFTSTCAEALMRGMLGDDIKDVLEDIKCTIGEVTNIVSGHARKGLVELGLTLKGSTPTVVVGHNHTIVHVTNSPVRVFPFETEYGSFFVEVVFDYT